MTKASISDSIFQPLEHLEARVHQSLENKDFDQALKIIQQVVEKLIACPSNIGFIFSSPALDALCQKIGAEICKEKSIFMQAADPRMDTILYIVTELYLAGGHTAIVEDLIRLQPSHQHIILLTDLSVHVSREKIEARFANLPVKLLWSSGTLTHKVLWLIHQIHHYQPKTIFLLPHHQDSVAIAALQPDVHPNVIFCHHADYQLCLGIHIEHFTHVDLSPTCFHHCRHQLGLKKNRYWPLTAIDKGKRTADQVFMKKGTLKTCSSGNAQRFESFYLYRYSDLIPSLLKATGGTHLHIGPLAESTLKAIYAGLEQHHVSQDHFIHVPWVKSVWETLIQEEIDLYIASFPMGGGKVSIEVMGSGTPMVVHSCYKSPFYSGECLVYPESFSWRRPHQLCSYLKDLTPEFLTEQSTCARDYYERYHLPEKLKEELNKDLSKMQEFEPRPLPMFRQDIFHTALDNALNYENLIHSHLQLIYTSTSWRVTAPLRALKNGYLKIKKKIKFYNKTNKN